MRLLINYRHLRLNGILTDALQRYFPSASLSYGKGFRDGAGFGYGDIYGDDYGYGYSGGHGYGQGRYGMYYESPFEYGRSSFSGNGEGDETTDTDDIYLSDFKALLWLRFKE